MQIGTVKIESKLALAPMAGVTDALPEADKQDDANP